MARAQRRGRGGASVFKIQRGWWTRERGCGHAIISLLADFAESSAYKKGQPYIHQDRKCSAHTPWIPLGHAPGAGASQSVRREASVHLLIQPRTTPPLGSQYWVLLLGRASKIPQKLDSFLLKLPEHMGDVLSAVPAISKREDQHYLQGTVL